MNWLRNAGVMVALGVLGGAGARGDDISGIVRDLQSPATHDRALAEFDALPLKTLAAAAMAAADPSVPARVRGEMDAHLDGLYARLRGGRMKAHDAARAAWIKSALEDAYRSSSRTNARWDAQAILALDHLQADADGFELMVNAIQAGCNNSIIETLYVIRGLQQRRLEADQAARRLDAALKLFDNSRYPDGTKFFMHMQLISLMTSLNWPADFKSKLNLEEEVHRALGLFTAYVGQNPDEVSVGNVLQDLWNAELSVQPDAVVAEENVKDAVGQALQGTSHLKHLEAMALIAEGMSKRDANGNATAQSYALWKQARAAAEAGWALDPLDYHCGEQVLRTFAKADEHKDVDLWARRTLLANPNDYDACMLKMFWLINCVNGEAALAWGRECVKMGTPRNRLAIVLRNAHTALSERSGARGGSYFLDPTVWADIQKVYDKLLSDTSRAVDDREQYLTDRARYLQMAELCGDTVAFLRLSEQFGDAFDMNVYGGRDYYAYEKQQALRSLAAEGIPAPQAALIALPAKKALPVVAMPTDGASPARRGRRGGGGAANQNQDMP